MTAAAQFAAARRDMARRPGLSGPGRRAALTDLTDSWLQGVFADAVRASSDPFCLVAVGGYGRGHLSLGSDLDLLLLHRASAPESARVAERLWYPVWDSGVKLDHSVRTVSEARRMASEDIKVVLGLLDARVIAGDATLATTLTSAVLSDWRAMADRRLPALRELVLQRRSRFGDLAQMLEPDLKECYGGLRDAVILRGVVASWVTDVPHSGYDGSVEFLLDVRDALHRVTGGSSDRLIMQEQAAVAEDLVGVADPDALLRAVYESARAIAYAADVTWHRVDRIERGRQRRHLRRVVRRGPDRLPLTDGVVLQDGEAVLALEARPGQDPALVFRAAAAAAQAGTPLSPHTVERLATESAEAPVPWTRDIREAFVSLLGSGPALVPVWEALDQVGIVDRVLPGWDEVRSQPQRNAIHRFTVDRHLVETAVNAGSLTRNVARPDLLLVSALLHDIGKGRGGDHSVVGADIASRLAARMGFDHDDCAVIVALVRHHLLLADTATRRDLDDPRVVQEVAALLGGADLLDLLHELTVADSLATGPSVSSEWRFSLIADLVDRVRAVLAGRPLPEPPGLTEQQEVALAQQGVWVLMDVLESSCLVTVAAPDRIGLLSMVAGVLSLNRLDVLAAKVTTVGGRAVQQWTVRPTFGDPPPVDRLGEDVRRAVEGSLDVASRLARRDADYAVPRSATAPDPLVLISQGATTVVEVRAHDEPGLLHRVTAAIAAADATIAGAKVSTLGADAVDVFFVTDPRGRPLSEDRAAALRTTVLATLARDASAR